MSMIQLITPLYLLLASDKLSCFTHKLSINITDYNIILFLFYDYLFYYLKTIDNDTKCDDHNTNDTQYIW